MSPAFCFAASAASCAVTAGSPVAGFGTPMILPSGSRIQAGVPRTRPCPLASASRLPTLSKWASWFSRSCCWLSSVVCWSCSLLIWNEFSLVLVLTSKMPSTPAITRAIITATNGARGALIGAGGATRSCGAVRLTRCGSATAVSSFNAAVPCVGAVRPARAGLRRAPRAPLPGTAVSPCSAVRPPDRGAYVRSLMALPLLLFPRA
jgi:hypothetical protein